MGYGEYDLIFFFVEVGRYYIAVFDAVVQYLFRKRIFEVFLNSAMQWPCAECLVVAFFSNIELCFFRKYHIEAQVVEALQYILHDDVDDLVDISLIERVEDNDIIDPVKKFRREGPLQRFLDNAFIIFFTVFRFC